MDLWAPVEQRDGSFGGESGQKQPIVSRIPMRGRCQDFLETRSPFRSPAVFPIQGKPANLPQADVL